MKNKILFPERVGHLSQIDNISTGWDHVIKAIRPECRDVEYLQKAKIALDNNLNDVAINYFWNLTIFDIQKKIMIYGIEYFSTSINWDGKPLKNVADLREVNDFTLLSGAYALGIIQDEAHFFLNQCRDVRNNFSTAHYSIGELDKIETMNFIKNCIKYVLAFDLPAPGLQIKDLIMRLSKEKLESPEDITTIIENQSPKVHGPILQSLFSNFIKPDCNFFLKHNIKDISPFIWTLVSDEIKSQIASKFGSLQEIDSRDAANEALNFLKIVNGVSFIPTSFKDVIFRKHAQNLFSAHFGSNNFYTEPTQAKELFSLGYDVPITALILYVKAVTLSYIGNRYGNSVNAEEYNEAMIYNLSNVGVKTLFMLLSEDIDIIRTLTDRKPCERLKLLMNDLMNEKTKTPEQQELYQFIVSSPASRIYHMYNKIYWKKVNVQN